MFGPFARCCAAAALLLALACDPPAGQASATAAPASTSESGGTTSDGGTTSGSPSGTTGGATDAPDTGFGPDYACDPFAQLGCPAGQKCNLYSKEGTIDLDAAKCVPLADPAKQIDDGCVAEGGYGTGLDDCDAGLICWNLGPMGDGTCVPLCNGNADDHPCPDGRLCAHGIGEYNFMCLPVCDPLAQNCIEGAGCYLSTFGFVCAPDKSGAEGQIYDACAYANVCDIGLMCAAPSSAPGCPDPDGTLGCCLPFCEVGGTGCDAGLECLPLFDPPEQFPDFVTFGVCGAPG